MSEKMWMIRAGEGGYLVDLFLKNGLVALGWEDVGSLSGKKLDEIKTLVEEKYPSTKGSVQSAASQLFRFVNELKIDDYVVTYNSSARVYHIGKILSEYQYKISEELDYPHIRMVNWLDSVSRDALDTDSKNTLGSIMTIFSVNPGVATDVLKKAQTKEIKQPDLEVQKDQEKTLKEDMKSKSFEFIKDEVNKLLPEEMEELSAGLMRAKGYKTMITAKGKDRGKDVLASLDGLGLTEPNIRVEVKHRKGSMGAPEIRSFIGGLRSHNRGLYISTGGFTQEAKYEAERSTIPITLMDIDLLVSQIIENYENFDIDTRTLIPLTKLYWPSK